MDCQEEMAKRCFGYGRWDAPFWFIGTEQGMSKDSRELAFRCQAWQERGGLDLDDCIDYHRDLAKLRPPKLNKWGKRKDDWHGENPDTQMTWARLIQFLIGLGAVGDHLDYQRNKWGSANGRTCVIELSGLPAHNSAEKRERSKYMDCRLARMMEALNGKQEFVLLYGKSSECQKAWSELTRGAVQVGYGSRREIVLRKANTLYLRVPFHPTGNGQPYEAWRSFGKRVREFQHAC